MTQRACSALLAAAVPAAWLVPNHYQPWVSAWSDGLALALIGFAALALRHGPRVPQPYWLFAAVAVVSAGLQVVSGQLLFHGDAVMLVLYLAAFLLALRVGGSCADDQAVEWLALGIVAAAIISVGIAAAQSAGLELGLYGVDLKPGMRPYGNVAQPNHLCTLVFLGLCFLAVLYERGRIGAVAGFLGGAYLSLGMVLSGSRTGWVQVTLALALVALLSARASSRLSFRTALPVAVVYALLVAAWPPLAKQLLLTGVRSFEQQGDAGTRLAHWTAMLDAIGREPWTGYGWMQATLAQQAVAIDHPPVGEHIEHAHNFVLDMIVWVGVPLGLVLLGALVNALRCAVRGVRDGVSLWLVIGIGAVLVHGLLEYPLAYAYFIIPVGLMLGVVHARGASTEPAAKSTRSLTAAWGAGMYLIFLALVAREYLLAEQNHRMLRLETARIGVSSIETPAVRLFMLDQLEAFQVFARTQARPGMHPDEVEAMRQASLRYAFPSAMLRYALVAGLNGDLEGSGLTLHRLCYIHPRARCEEADAAWTAARQKWPVLQGVAPPPLANIPPPRAVSP